MSNLYCASTGLRLADFRNAEANQQLEKVFWMRWKLESDEAPEVLIDDMIEYYLLREELLSCERRRLEMSEADEKKSDVRPGPQVDNLACAQFIKRMIIKDSLKHLYSFQSSWIRYDDLDEKNDTAWFTFSLEQKSFPEKRYKLTIGSVE